MENLDPDYQPLKADTWRSITIVILFFCVIAAVAISIANKVLLVQALCFTLFLGFVFYGLPFAMWLLHREVEARERMEETKLA